MAQRTVKFGIIGAGLMGREFASAAARWCHLIGQDVKPEIVAVCDPNFDATHWFTENFDIKLATMGYLDLLQDPDVEAVYCAVPHMLHAEIYSAVIDAGKHLLAEKPFGIDFPACQVILEAIRRRPDVLVRCSSQFPFYPGAQRIAKMVDEGEFGKIIEVRAGFLHSSDLDPKKPINWKRRIATNGEYGCLGDLGMHVVHLPARFGWRPKNVRALLSRVYDERPDGKGGMAMCETWDNAVLACQTEDFPMFLETKRISPGDTNTWYIRILGTKNSAEFTTKFPKTLRTMPFHGGSHQAWREEDLGYESAYHAITGHIFEFGFVDAIQQMWAAFLDELAHGENMKGPFRCATPEEVFLSHRLFTAALESQKQNSVVDIS
jgi:predicted dehydrogenase